MVVEEEQEVNLLPILQVVLVVVVPIVRQMAGRKHSTNITYREIMVERVALVLKEVAAVVLEVLD